MNFRYIRCTIKVIEKDKINEQLTYKVIIYDYTYSKNNDYLIIRFLF